MRAWQVAELGEPADVLRLVDTADVEPGPGQVAVAVEACGLNFPDILVCQGRYQDKPPLPFTPGMEAVGRVVGAGEGATTPVGTRAIVMPAMPAGGLAERCLAADGAVFPVADDMPAAHAAAMHITYQTGWFGLHRRAHLQAGETLLVHAGAGGVGSAAIQLGVAAGARVLATAGGPEKVQVCKDLGADVAIDYSSEDFVAAVKDATDGRGADVIYDPVGGDVFDRSRKCVAWEGRILVIGFTSGRIPEIAANQVLLKNCAVMGLYWGRYMTVDPALVHDCHRELVRLHAAGVVDPLIYRELPLEDAPEALGLLATRGTFGKIVVRPG